MTFFCGVNLTFFFSSRKVHFLFFVVFGFFFFPKEGKHSCNS